MKINKNYILAVYVFLARARWRPLITRAKQWPGKAEDEWIRDQDGMEEPAAWDENGTRRQYDGAEDTDGNHVNKINSRADGRRKDISRIHGNIDAVPSP